MIRTNTELLEYISNAIKMPSTYFVEEKIKKNTCWIEQNQKIFHVYVIKSGVAKCYLTQDTGNDFIQEFFGEGELFGEVEAIRDGQSFCAIEAILDMEVYKIATTHFLELLENDKVFNKLIFKSMASKIKYKAIRHSYNQSHSIKLNLLRLKKQFPNLFSIIPKQDIANYLGVTLRSFNRVLQEIEK
ncbi:Crp/Fnr family transcriptional regulator [Bernardetia sp.]|uniref:Crp/Fnr family transcriptional regulator n=1 Tax=Bernardetia sp. TaxID=1937974 RepID=UPI0025BE6164|nr:Crp/Fnr family transcriptional regulator [Bernardetia sp.]